MNSSKVLKYYLESASLESTVIHGSAHRTSPTLKAGHLSDLT